LYSDLAAEAAVRYGLRDLLPLLRSRADGVPSESLLRALGALGDREAVPLLVRGLEREDLRLASLESLGRVGGPEACVALQHAALSLDAAPETRAAFKALAACAGPGDDAAFRAAAGHPDWQVRLTSAEVLGRFRRPENLAALTRLAGDSVPAVAHRALAVLEG
jgi:HEAT repeat protein